MIFVFKPSSLYAHINLNQYILLKFFLRNNYRFHYNPEWILESKPLRLDIKCIAEEQINRKGRPTRIRFPTRYVQIVQMRNPKENRDATRIYYRLYELYPYSISKYHHVHWRQKRKILEILYQLVKEREKIWLASNGKNIIFHNI